jgi:type II secretory pathway pseudopilin PulG
MERTPQRLGNRGFMLLDATIASVILSFVMVSMISLFLLSIRANTDSERTSMAAQLSIRLLEEVQLRKWDEKSPIPNEAIKDGTNPPLGTDGVENPSDKRTFNDIDDFTGWVENPPKDPLMNPLTQFYIYTSSVSVGYVSSSLAPSGGRTDYKRISVCTWSAKIKSVCLYTIRTNR